MRCAKATLSMGTGFSSFTTRLLWNRSRVQTLSKKFLPETDAAIDELLSFQVEVEVFSISAIQKILNRPK
jgi:hypothetical protein